MKQVNIFLGGGVALLEGNGEQVGYRPSAVDPVISKLNARKDAHYFYIVKTFSDLIHEYTPEGHQEHYLHYVEKEADIALFIFDGRIGDKTKLEVERACNNNESNNHPTIFFYGTNLEEQDDIVRYLDSKHQYFQHFKDREQLMQLISDDLSQWHTSKAKPVKLLRRLLLLTIGILLIGGMSFLMPRGCKKSAAVWNDSVYDSTACIISLNLMKYADLNRFTNNAYNDSLMSMYHFEKSISADNELCVYPSSPVLTLDGMESVSVMIPFDSIPYHNPTFQLSMEGVGEETILFKKAEIEVEDYRIADAFYSFVRQGNMLVVRNESNVVQPFDLRYSTMHPEESFLSFACQATRDGFSDTLCISWVGQTSFLGCLNKRFNIQGTTHVPQVTCRPSGVKTIVVDRVAHTYPLSSYNTTKGETKMEFSRSLSNKELDEEVFFSVAARESCSFKFRIKLIDIHNKIAYSNYVYLHYYKPRSGKLNP